MHGIRSSFFFYVRTICIAKVILSSHVTDETDATTTTTDVSSTLSPTAEPKTVSVTDETDATTTTTDVSSTFSPTDEPKTLSEIDKTSTLGTSVLTTLKLHSSYGDGVTTVTGETNTVGTSVLTTVRRDPSDEYDATTDPATQNLFSSDTMKTPGIATFTQTDSVDSVTVQTSSRVTTSQVAKSTFEPTTLELATTLVPSTEVPFSFECLNNTCPNQERCFIRRAPIGPEYVCECAPDTRSTYGFDCQYRYYDFDGTVPLRTCYGPQCATGSQSSQNYPNHYKHSTRQMMVVYVPGAYRFDLSFDSRGIDIETHKDHLVIGGGFRPPFDRLVIDPEERNAVQEVDAVRFIQGKVIPDDFSIYNDSMWIWFETDRTINRKGFNVTWRSVAIDVECPEEITLNLPDDSSYVTGWTPTVLGAGVGIENVDVTSSDGLDYNYTIGSYDVQYLYTDVLRNTAECNTRLTIKDVTKPVVDCPENVELQTCNRSEAVWSKPTASDNSDEMVTEEMQIINGGSNSIQRGRNTLVYTFSDQSGNTQECRFEVNLDCYLDGKGFFQGVEFWIVLAAVVGLIGLLLLILAVFARAKLASIKAANTIHLSFNPENVTGHKPGEALEEEEETPSKGKEKIGMYDLQGEDV